MPSGDEIMNMQIKKSSSLSWRFDAACGLLTLGVVLCLADTQAGPSNQTARFIAIEAVKTEVINGFFIGLTGLADGASDYSTNSTSPDDKLVFIPWTTKDPAWIAFPADLEYACEIELLDTNRAKVPKTELGKKVGAKFLDFDVGAYKKGIKLKRERADKEGEPVATPILFYPSRTRDLFRIEEPGNYTLKIRFQILAFPRTGPKRGHYTNQLIRFPTLNYPIVVPKGTSQKPQ